MSEPSKKREGKVHQPKEESFLSLIPAEIRQLDDDGWKAKDVSVAEERSRQADLEEEARREGLRYRLAELGVPVKDIEVILADELDDLRAMQVVRRWLVSEKKQTTVLVMAGNLGAGKTTAAAWWICQQHQPHRYIRTRPLLYLPAARLARWPKYGGDVQASAINVLPPAVKDLFHAQALVIDDLGVEFDDKSGSFLSFFDELIDCRYAGRLPTIITTNIPIQSKNPKEVTLERRYGKRFMERVVIVGVEGESLRKKETKK